jgi:hypothetical protein
MISEGPAGASQCAGLQWVEGGHEADDGTEQGVRQTLGVGCRSGCLIDLALAPQPPHKEESCDPKSKYEQANRRVLAFEVVPDHQGDTRQR